MCKSTRKEKQRETRRGKKEEKEEARKGGQKDRKDDHSIGARNNEIIILYITRKGCKKSKEVGENARKVWKEREKSPASQSTLVHRL